MLNGKNTFIYALLGGILLSLSWFFSLTALIFIAFVPLLLIEKKYSESESGKRKKIHLILLTYFTFLIWNSFATWWIWYASASGALMAIISNSVFMTIVFVTFSNIKNKLNKPWAIWLLILLYYLK
jgi:apolipoprotein N-acyltransferase